MNNGKPTHFSIRNGTFSAIDLTLTNTSLSPLLEWDVHDDLCSSDHFPIIMKFPTVNAPSFSTKKYLFDKTNWETYQNFTDIVSLSYEDTNLHTKLNILYDTIRNAVNLTIPSKQTIHKNRQVPWWSEKIARLIKDRKRNLRKYKKSKLLSDLIDFKKARALARLEINSQKQQSWQQFINSINTTSSDKEIWTKIKNIKMGTQTQYDRINSIRLAATNNITTDIKIIVEEFASYLERGPNEEQPDNFDFNILKTNENLNYNANITQIELEEALNNTKKSSPGCDEIHIEMIQNLHYSSKDLLLNIYNHIWTTQNDPSRMETSNNRSHPKTIQK